jgi:hypothetical protein
MVAHRAPCRASKTIPSSSAFPSSYCLQVRQHDSSPLSYMTCCGRMWLRVLTLPLAAWPHQGMSWSQSPDRTLIAHSFAPATKIGDFQKGRPTETPPRSSLARGASCQLRSTLPCSSPTMALTRRRPRGGRWPRVTRGTQDRLWQPERWSELLVSRSVCASRHAMALAHPHSSSTIAQKVSKSRIFSTSYNGG